MRHTLVAAFRTETDANRTRADLMSRGIPREHIHAVGADSADIHGYGAPYSTTDTTVDRTDHDTRVSGFFSSLFDSDTPDEHRRNAEAYPEAVRRGALVIAVDVDDDDELVKARDALEYNGAVSIDDRGDDTGALRDYPGPSSPYAGATGGDSHLDKHFTKPRSDAPSAHSDAPSNSAVGTEHATDTTPTRLTATRPTPVATRWAAPPNEPAPITRTPPPPRHRPAPERPAMAPVTWDRASMPARPNHAATG